MDDTHTMHYTIFFRGDGQAVDEAAYPRDFKCVPGVHIDPVTFQLDTQRSNWWLQDRDAMENGSFCGIPGIPRQDVACQESMGEIVDRSAEHLGTSDVAIIRFRRRYLENIRNVAAGQPAIGAERSIDWPHLRSEQRIIPIEEPWQQVGAFAGEFALSK